MPIRVSERLGESEMNRAFVEMPSHSASIHDGACSGMRGHFVSYAR